MQVVIAPQSYAPGQAAYPAPGVLCVILYLKIFGALMFAAGLVAYPAHALAGAQNGLRIWASSVAPAIFPFIAVMPYLTCAEARSVYNRLFGKTVGFLFGLPGNTAAAIIVGLVSGSPAGAVAVARVAAAEGLTKGEAARLAGIACGVSPIYALSVMGMGLNSSVTVGWSLVFAQLTAQVITGIIFRKGFKGSAESVIDNAYREDEQSSIIDAVLAVLRVGGYMTLFSVGISLGRQIMGERISYLSVIIDLPTGLECISRLGWPVWTHAAALGFGGLCIISQNIGVLSAIGVKSSCYVVQKIVSGIVCCAAYCALNWCIPGEKSPVMTGSVGLFEVNMLVCAVFMVPVTAVFLIKQSKKHFS